MGDPLFRLRSAFHTGAYNTVVNEGSNLSNLSDKDAIERDCFVYRSYIAQGSYEVRSRLSGAEARARLAWCRDSNAVCACLPVRSSPLVKSQTPPRQGCKL